MSNVENSLGDLIGSGGTADVYEWANNEVIKVFKHHVHTEVIKNMTKPLFIHV